MGGKKKWHISRELWDEAKKKCRMQEFLSYVENTTDAFAKQALSPLIQEIHRRVKAVKESKEMEVEYMTLLQRDRENIELGREEGSENMALLIKILITENRID